LVGLQNRTQPIPVPQTVCSLEEELINSELIVTVHKALSDLPPLQSGQDGENLDYISSPISHYQKLMRDYISPIQYLDLLRVNRDVCKEKSVQLSIF
jgi:DNA (cytosine-5)-methyltransferase 1